jgi:hypothetical protein
MLNNHMSPETYKVAALCNDRRICECAVKLNAEHFG